MTGQENMKARPARAGFMKFWPMPPKSCLTMMMAKKSPMIIHQYGVVTGQTKASRRPVTMADRSPTVQSSFITLRYAHSKNTQAAQETAQSIRERMPKNTQAPIRAGSSAMMTSSMMLRVDSLECA